MLMSMALPRAPTLLNKSIQKQECDVPSFQIRSFLQTDHYLNPNFQQAGYLNCLVVYHP